MTEDHGVESTSTDSFAELVDQLEPVINIVSGHRLKLIAAGFSEEAAESMAVQMHAMVMATIARGASK